MGELEATCSGAKNNEDCSSLLLSLGFCCIWALSLGVPRTGDVGSGDTGLDESSVSVLALFMAGCLPPWGWNSHCVWNASFLFPLS